MKEKTEALGKFCDRCGQAAGVREVDLGVFETDAQGDAVKAEAPRCRLHAHLCWSCGDLIVERLNVWMKDLK